MKNFIGIYSSKIIESALLCKSHNITDIIKTYSIKEVTVYVFCGQFNCDTFG